MVVLGGGAVSYERGTPVQCSSSERVEREERLGLRTRHTLEPLAWYWSHWLGIGAIGQEVTQVGTLPRDGDRRAELVQG